MRYISGNMKTYISLIFLIFFMLIFSACSSEKNNTFQGYAEGDFLYLSSPLGGSLENLTVKKGQTVQKGDMLFSLEQEFEKAGAHDATEIFKQANNRLANLQKGLRPSEIDAIKARLKQAELSLQLAEAEYKHHALLFKKQNISEEERDKYHKAYEQEQQQVRQIEAELKTAQLGAREDEIFAAEAQAESAKAKLDQANWNLAQKTLTAPDTGLIFDTFYRQGEYVAGGRPVLALLPPGNIKVRFFVPETLVSQFKIGESVKISFDGTQTPVNAHISFISPQSEYTPPIIYSSKSRAKLVFMLEALPDDLKSALILHPGQPVDVRRDRGVKD